MHAPWIKNYYNIDEMQYIIPNIDSVIIGGTAQYGYATLARTYAVHCIT